MSAFLFFTAAIVVLGLGLWYTDRKPERERAHMVDLLHRTSIPDPTPEERKAIEAAGLTVEQWRQAKYPPTSER